MGTVYKAEHLFLKRQVALKVINQSLVQDEKMRQRFFKEMQAVAQLHHPNIVQIYDADVAGHTSFLVMELLEGMGLQTVVRQKGPLPIRQACEFTWQTAAGMQHALECGILHRDIKPNNLMLTPEGTVKILDFGLAGFLGEAVVGSSSFDLSLDSPDAIDEDPHETAKSKTALLSSRLTSQILGTPDFLAPEMAQAMQEADVRADIYSLGCTLYFLLTGRVPFPSGGTRHKIRCHRGETPTPLRRLRSEIPERLESAVARMMAKFPEDRYQAPADVIEALGPFAASNRGTVLIVDDDPLIQTTLTLVLEGQGFTVRLAGDGQEALHVLRQEPLPQLILLDLKMPGMDGFEFLRERQGDAALAAVPVVVLSGLRPDIAGQIVGAVDYLIKPIEPLEVAKQIQRYLPNADTHAQRPDH
jgi:serine/threonine protein kinase